MLWVGRDGQNMDMVDRGKAHKFLFGEIACCPEDYEDGIFLYCWGGGHHRREVATAAR